MTAKRSRRLAGLVARSATRRVEEGASVAHIVREYIDSHPLVHNALALGIVNLSALARHILDETGLDQEEAVAMAIRRYEPTLAQATANGMKDRLARCRLEIHTGFCQLAVRADWTLLARVADVLGALDAENHPVYVLHGREAVTVLADEAVATQLAKALGREVLAHETGFVGIIVHSPEDLQEVPGFLAQLVGSLAARHVNLVEMVSCNQDTLLMVANEQMAAAVAVLDELTRG